MGSIAIIGSGYGGAVLASALQAIGYRVYLIEKEKHPRFAIGESSTPLSNFLMESLGRRYGIRHLFELSSYGRWMKHHPDIPVGLKRGFTFYFHDRNGGFLENETMQVAASPDDDVADTHWYRPALDSFLVHQASQAGVHYMELTEVTDVQWLPTSTQITISSKDPISFRKSRQVLDVDFLIDASGSPSFGQKFFGEQNLSAPSFGKDVWDRISVFGHLRGISPFQHFFAPSSLVVFPPDSAAVHHIFEGGWIWVLPFNNGVTSVGASLNMSCFPDAHRMSAIAVWNNLMERLPEIKTQLGVGNVETGMFMSRPLQFRQESASGLTQGKRWIALPSSFGFTDPLLSTGFSLNLLGISRICQKLESGIPGEDELKSFGTDYHNETAFDLDTAEKFLSPLLSTTGNSKAFKSRAMAYFLGIIIQEVRSRLNLSSPHSGFLSRENVQWMENAEWLLGLHGISDEITARSSPWDIAGITEYDNHQIPASRHGLIKNRDRIPASTEDIDKLLHDARRLDWPTSDI